MRQSSLGGVASIFVIYFAIPIVILGSEQITLLILLWCVALHIYALVKVIVIKIAGLDITEICLGIPVGPTYRTHRFGTACVYTVLPILPIAYSAPRTVATQRLASERPVLAKWVRITLNIISPFVYVALMASMLFVTSQHPLHGGVVRIESVNPLSELGKAGIKAGDYLMLGNSFRITRWEELSTIAGKQPTCTLTFMRAGQYLDPISLKGTKSAPCGDVGTNVFRDIDAEENIIVAEAQTGSPAEDAGIQPGDVLVSVDGSPVSGIQAMISALRQTHGEYLPLTIRRGQQVLASRLYLGRQNHGVSRLGLKVFSGISYLPNPVIVSNLWPNTVLSRAGLRQGDIVLLVDGATIDGTRDFQRRINQMHNGQTRLVVLRQDKKVEIRFNRADISAEPWTAHDVSTETLSRVDTSFWRSILAGVKYAGFAASVPFQFCAEVCLRAVNPYGVYYLWWPAGRNVYNTLLMSGGTSIGETPSYVTGLASVALILSPFIFFYEYCHAGAQVILSVEGRTSRVFMGIGLLLLFGVSVCGFLRDSDFVQTYHCYVDTGRRVDLLELSLWEI